MSKTSRTSSLLSSIRLTPNLPPQSWYLIAGVTLSTLNKPDEIPHVFHYAIEKDGRSQQTQLDIARRMREALIKTAAIGGLPKSINALLALKKVTPQALVDEPLGYSPTGRSMELYDVPSSKIMQRGQLFFDHIYGKVSKQVMDQMDRSGTEDLGITARLMLIPSTSVLMLPKFYLPTDGALFRLKGHLKGALNNGASVKEVRAVRTVIVRLCEAFGMTRLGQDASSGWGWLCKSSAASSRLDIKYHSG
ncbi:MAG: hypothetical protein Q9213_005061 [Squamulea squamosa]